SCVINLFETVLKVFPHSPQTCGRSPVCVRRCSARCMLCTKPLSQNSHRNGRSPECVRRCSRRCVFWRNRFPQIAQGYGRSPVCTLWCSVTFAREEKVFPHTLHWNGRSPVCVRRWFRRWICFLNGFPQMLHLKRLSVV
uniref:Uncharacterized protein n=1 Tax=Cyprinus carpio carpio TaxID=630221 RepID=A0A8C0YKV6_CYPCA